MAGLFGGSRSTGGPDPEQIKAQRQQSQQVNKRSAKEDRGLQARQRLISAAQQRGGPVTLFSKTGYGGVKTNTLGGGAQ